MNVGGKRIAFITNIARPYRTPLFESLNRQATTLGGALEVFYFSNIKHHERRRGSEETAGDFPATSVRGIELSRGYERVLSIPLTLWFELFRFRPSVVISGGFGPAGYLAWLYAATARIPYIQWSGAIPGASRQATTGQRLQGFLAQRATASVTYGTAARDYLVQMGVDPEHIVVGVNTVDTLYFSERAQQVTAEAAALKLSARSAGIDLLYVGSLVPRKGHSNLLRALAQLPGETPNWHLHLVGGGPLEDKLRAEADGLGLRERVSFWGARRPAEMPLFYAMADIFVLPTLQDIWGLVLNEAMACGVPVIASSLAGATRDLVEHGLNGLEVDPQDLAGFTEALQRLINDSQLRARMGKAALATIQSRATIDHSAAAFMRALQLA